MAVETQEGHVNKIEGDAFEISLQVNNITQETCIFGETIKLALLTKSSSLIHKGKKKPLAWIDVQSNTISLMIGKLQNPRSNQILEAKQQLHTGNSRKD